MLCAVLGVHAAQGAAVASTSTSTYAFGQVSRIPSELRDQRAFARAAQADPLRRTPASRLLTGLRGKDVLFVFVESYGRVAVQDSSMAPGVDRVLADGTRRLDAAGFGSRSAFLTSPTFGAISWLAHSTLQSGLWVDSQQRYDVLVTSPRFTLSQAFGRAGWRTVSDVPADTHDWPQGAFYHYDQLYDSRNVGYRGPRFGYPTMPDQYTLDAFHRLELARQHRPPVMAEIDLITSHAPVVPDPAPGRPGRRRGRVGVRRDAGAGALQDRDLAVAGPGAGGVRAVDRVLPVGARVVPRALRRRPDRCWCSSATTSRPRSSPGRAPTTTCP